MKAAEEERRSPHVRRVPLVALVDICQNSGDASPFQAHSANVSGRGMEVRTSYLPELADELVCRFEHDGQEILVEGRVAWRSESEEGGEFGIQFTALDADSAEVLRTLGQAESARRASSTASSLAVESETPLRLELAQGQRVRLHMEGLGAPMKASVRVGGDRRIHVGSGLEFLKVGRTLEVEELEGGERRAARVDSVNVVINPQTSVPELVVQLRYEGISETPPPAGVAFAAERGEHSGAADEDALDEDDEEAEGPWESADALSEKLSGLVDRVGLVAQAAGRTMGSAFSAVAQQGEAARKRAFERRPRSGEEPDGVAGSTKRRPQRQQRSTGRAPSHLRSGIHDLNMTGQTRSHARRTTRTSTPMPAPKKSSRARLFALLGVVVLLVGSAAGLRALGLGNDASSGEPAPSAAAASPAEAEAKPAPSKVVATPPAKSPEGIVADVPLFGPRTVAQEESAVANEEVNVEHAEKLAAAAAVPDESWDETPLAAQKAAADPWGRGRLHLPTIHRIRLDSEGGRLSGAVEPNGFVVVVPGRKAMESGRSIQKRDKRIASVTASNTDDGAKMRFQFRGPVPPYRVRVRKDFVEFLISAPEDGVAAL